MDCTTIREAVSAELDGEAGCVARTDLEEHLAGCAACRDWQDRAAMVTRQARLTAAAPVPDLRASTLAVVRLPRPKRGLHLLRLVLVVVAAIQTVLALAEIVIPVGMPAAMPMGGHLTHETAAFNLGLGIALGFVALRPRQAMSQLPLLGSFILVLVVLCAVDLSDGEVGWSRVITHVPAVAGLLVVTLIGLRHRGSTEPRRSALGVEQREGTSSDAAYRRANQRGAAFSGSSTEPGGPTTPPAARREVA